MRKATYLFAAAALALIAPSAAQTATLQDIKSKGELVVAVEASYPPFAFIENGQIVGYDADLLKIVLQDLVTQGVKINASDQPWPGMLPGLLAGKYDMIGSPVYMKADRFKKFNFTVPTSEATTGLISRKDDLSIKTVDDIVGKVVGGQQGAGSLAVFKTFNEELKKRKGAGAKEIKEYIAPPEALADLGNKRIDAYVDALAFLGRPVKQSPEKYQVLGAVGPKAYFGWVTRLEDQELRDYLSERITKLKKDGTIDKLQKKWFGLTMDNPSSNYEPTE